MKTSMKVIKCSWKTISEMLLTYHYLHRMPAGILQCFALYNDDNLIFPIGGAVFSNGRIQYKGKYLDFSRLYLYDEIPRNSESFFIGQCIKELKKDYPSYEGIVSWADPNNGHTGTIYKASNFVLDGMSRKVKKYKSKNGTIVYQRTVLDTSQFEELKSDNPKYRYIYYFDNKKRERLKNKTVLT